MKLHDIIEMACAITARSMPGLYVNPVLIKRSFPNVEIAPTDPIIDSALAAVHRQTAQFYQTPCGGRS
jgi:hypothetical protein